MGRIAVAGHICVDIKPHLGAGVVTQPGRLVEVGPLAMLTGGSVANTGRVLAWLGADVVAYITLGDDALGHVMRDLFSGVEGLELVADERPGVGTSYTVIVEPEGVDRTLWHHPGSNAWFDPDMVDLSGVDMLHFGYPPLMPGFWQDGGEKLTTLMQRAKAAGVVTSLDLAGVDPLTAVGQADWRAILARCMPYVDIVTPSYDDVASAFHVSPGFDAARWSGFAEQFLEWGAAVTVITAGQHGLRLAAADAERLTPLAQYGIDSGRWAGASEVAPARPLAVQATTTGAGDAASAGVLVALRSGSDPADLLAFTANVAAKVIERGGPNHVSRTKE